MGEVEAGDTEEGALAEEGVEGDLEARILGEAATLGDARVGGGGAATGEMAVTTAAGTMEVGPTGTSEGLGITTILTITIINLTWRIPAVMATPSVSEGTDMDVVGVPAPAESVCPMGDDDGAASMRIQGAGRRRASDCRERLMGRLRAAFIHSFPAFTGFGRCASFAEFG